MRTMKVSIEFEIEAEVGDHEAIRDAVRDELSAIIEDEDPLDRRGVSVDLNEEEDEE